MKRGDREIALTAKEFALLSYLMSHPGKVLSRTRLLSNVWGYSFEPGTKVVDVYIRYLRKKIEDGEAPLIHTVRGSATRSPPSRQGLVPRFTRGAHGDTLAHDPEIPGSGGDSLLATLSPSAPSRSRRRSSISTRQYLDRPAAPKRARASRHVVATASLDASAPFESSTSRREGEG